MKTISAAMAQLVEHILGKDEVPGPNPGSSSRRPRRLSFGALVFYRLLHTFKEKQTSEGSSGAATPKAEWVSCIARIRFAYRTRSSGSLLTRRRVWVSSHSDYPEKLQTVSLRLGHFSGLTVHRTVIQYLEAATLPRRLSFGALVFYRLFADI